MSLSAPALAPVALKGSNGVSGSNLAKIYEIKRRMNRSFIDLRRGCLDQMGVTVVHGTPKVRAASRTFAKKAHEATGLKYADVIVLLDQHSLGLETN